MTDLTKMTAADAREAARFTASEVMGAAWGQALETLKLSFDTPQAIRMARAAYTRRATIEAAMRQAIEDAICEIAREDLRTAEQAPALPGQG